MNGAAINKKRDSEDQDWQSSKSSTLERAEYLLETGLYADCEFFVGGDNDGTEKELIKAHKIFLVMSSPVFEKMFFGEMTKVASILSPINVPISLPDITPSSFKDLLRYMYTDSLNLESVDQAMVLCYAAKKYILPDLLNICICYVKNKLSPEYTCRALEFVEFFDDEQLKLKCWRMLRERTKESLTSSDLEDLSESTMLSIVKEEALNIREVELFDAVVRWAKRQCSEQELEINGTNMRKVLNNIISQIRFLSMSSAEFASSPVLSKILTEKECLSFFQNINNADSWPLPGVLSSSRKLRSPKISYVLTDGAMFSSSGILPTRKRARF